jgi:hypothetical protein
MDHAAQASSPAKAASSARKTAPLLFGRMWRAVARLFG